MKRKEKFKELIPYTLRSVPYILQSHVFKAYCALENLYADRPHLPHSVWDYCTRIIREDEPKVKGIIEASLLEIKEITDHTSGRNFGPDWILGHGLMPLSYWAMHKKIEEIGFTNLFKSYLEKALEGPIVLGHEISVLAGNWQFYNEVIAPGVSHEDQTLFMQRLTEFITTTFAHGHHTSFAHPSIDDIPTSKALVKEALHNPGFFGHNILACVWSERVKQYLDDAQYEKMRYNLAVLVRWHEFGKKPHHLQAHDQAWSEADLDQHLVEFFHQGPSNIHQITLSEALLSIWNMYPEYKKLVAANFLCFTQGTRP